MGIAMAFSGGFMMLLFYGQELVPETSLSSEQRCGTYFK